MNISNAYIVDRQHHAEPTIFSRIRVNHLDLNYSTPNGELSAINDVSFTIERGNILCIVGPSGCGKSTLLNALSGFIGPTGGRIEVEGADRDFAALRRGVVFQDYALFPWRTARHNVEFSLEVRGVPAERRSEIADYVLKQVGLHKFADFYPHRLSGGMRQRVAVARALAFDPDLLLMDEPFAALDDDMRQELQDLVIQLWQDAPRTIVYVTHSIQEAVFLAHQVIVLTSRPGRIRDQIRIDLPYPRDRFSDEFHIYVKQLTQITRRSN